MPFGARTQEFMCVEREETRDGFRGGSLIDVPFFFSFCVVCMSAHIHSLSHMCPRATTMLVTFERALSLQRTKEIQTSSPPGIPGIVGGYKMCVVMQP